MLEKRKKLLKPFTMKQSQLSPEHEIDKKNLHEYFNSDPLDLIVSTEKSSSSPACMGGRALSYCYLGTIKESKPQEIPSFSLTSSNQEKQRKGNKNTCR